jgi:SulP family sulfate permease
VLIIRLKNVSTIDSSGLHALTEIVHRSLKDGVRVMLADLHAQPMVVLTNSGLLDTIGEHDTTHTLDEAIAEAREYLGVELRGEKEGGESRKQTAGSSQLPRG